MLSQPKIYSDIPGTGRDLIESYLSPEYLAAHKEWFDLDKGVARFQKEAPRSNKKIGRDET